MNDALELQELDQHDPKLFKDDRTGGLAKVWITDGLTRRWVRDTAEVSYMQSLFHMSSSGTANLMVIPYTVVQRIPLVGDAPP